MTTLGSYQFEKLEGRHHEANLLAERAHMRLAGFPDLLRKNRFPVRGQILEVGTAQGIRARLMAELYPETHITAIDRSDELLNVAKETHIDLKNLSFQTADVYQLPFADASFDFIYARLVFMHLSDPLLALVELKRVLKSGGRLLIEDADRDCMFFEPQPPSFAPFWKNVQDGQRRLGGQPNIGRQLSPLLKQSGFQNTQIEVQTLLGTGDEIEFLTRTLMPSLNLYLNPDDRAEGARAIEDLARLAQNPLATFYHFWFVVTGEKL